MVNSERTERSKKKSVMLFHRASRTCVQHTFCFAERIKRSKFKIYRTSPRDRLKKNKSVNSELVRPKKLVCIFSEITTLQSVKVKEWDALESWCGHAD